MPTPDPLVPDPFADARYVGFWARVLASLVDTVLLTLVMALIAWFVFGTNDFDLTGEQPTSPAHLLLSLALPALIVIVFWRRLQATPGKMLIAARIVDATTGADPSNRQLLLRYVGYYVSGFVLLLGFVWVAFDARKQGWHDKMANTVVIRDVDADRR